MQRAMELSQKLAILADAAKYDASCASSGAKTTRRGAKIGSTQGMGICHSYAPDGRCISLLKILLTNYCIFDCQYCVNRTSSDTPRARFSVDEVVQLTLDFYRRNYIEGLFLSSGILQTPDYTMEQLTQVARTLREQHSFGGYIHLKTIPGAAETLIQEAGKWADRLSVNIELPTPSDLQQLAPEKNHTEIVTAMDGISTRIDEVKADRRSGMKAPRFTPAGQTTQMIVGATATPDSQILATASELYRGPKLRRVYYSAYSPIPHADAQLPAQTPPLVREHRLYQADWLLRFYGFSVEEITVRADGNLDLEVDPKLAWALAHREFFPVDVNRASRAELLRIPGVGARSVTRMLAVRRHHALRTEDLQKLKVAWKRAQHFVVTADHNPHVLSLDQLNLGRVIQGKERQLTLFDLAETSRTGEL